jgi:hypothetical protein
MACEGDRGYADNSFKLGAAEGLICILKLAKISQPS